MIICGRCGQVCYDADRGPVYALMAHRMWEHSDAWEDFRVTTAGWIRERRAS